MGYNVQMERRRIEFVTSLPSNIARDSDDLRCAESNAPAGASCTGKRIGDWVVENKVLYDKFEMEIGHFV